MNIGEGFNISERIGTVESVYIHLLHEARITANHIDGMNSEISGAKAD